ncbi:MULTISPECIES: Stealth CR1 domain-containing protein [Streptococcus]|uniref:Stealth CR1 domain-containing protein n=1 Tax=Streptococcus TaxID=1301 RepID=UPI000941EBA0|nr:MULTISPECIES: Stealth CR1 domain-containing protein [Streptococcus]
MPKIDFVVTWVDNTDLNWQRSKAKYSGDNSLNSEHRFRDMNTFHYWFRSIEKFAPWVNKIFLITEGHLPEWLDTSHPKLRVVKHSDYIPKEFLPTFNSNVIELNLHRIPELSEHFVIFNDDFFLTQPLKPEDYFKNGLPRLLGVYRFIIPLEKFNHIELNNILVMNKYFFNRKSLKKHPLKFFNYRYGKSNLTNLLSLAKNGIPAYKDIHVSQPHLKSTFKKLWSLEPELFNNVSSNRFRTLEDVNHWLMGYWNIETNMFYPQDVNFGTYVSIGDKDRVRELLTSKKYKNICVNDDFNSDNFEMEVNNLVKVLDGIFPEKGSFEK